jgi:hypothetical protein
MAAPVAIASTTLHTSASLGAAATATDNLAITTSFEAQLMVKVTAGGTVAATFGCKIEVYKLYTSTTYGSAGTGTLNPNYSYTLAGYTASQVVYSPGIFIPTGSWTVKITNLDATNAITVESIYDGVSAIS